MFNKIARYRKKSKLTQIELAEKLGISQSTLSSWESGKTTPSMDAVRQMAKLFDCTEFDLFERGKRYAEIGHISEVDNDEILMYFKEIDELINVTRYMTPEDRKRLFSIAKAAFPDAFEAAKSKELHYDPNR